MSVKLPNGVYFYSCIYMDSFHRPIGTSDGVVEIYNNNKYEDMREALLKNR